MRTLIILSVLVVMAFGVVGCQKDAHQLYSERQYRMTQLANNRMLVDDVQMVMLEDRPSHLSSFVQE